MNRFYYDAPHEAALVYGSTVQRTIGAKDLLIAAVNTALVSEGWVSTPKKARQTFTTVLPMAGFEPGLPSWSSVQATYMDGTTSPFFIIADRIPEGYLPPTGYQIFKNFNGDPDAEDTLDQIILFAETYAGATLVSKSYSPDSGWTAVVEYDSVQNQGTQIGIGLSLRTSQTMRGGGGYTMTSQPIGGSYITVEHTAAVRFIDSAWGHPKIRFGYTSIADDALYGEYFGNEYPVYVTVSPYSLSIVPVTTTQNWQSVHCAALIASLPSSFGACCYSYRKWLTTNGYTYALHNGSEYWNKNLRFLTLRCGQLDYQIEPVKWISGEAQLSEPFITMESVGKYELLGRVPYAYNAFDRLVDPDSTEWSAKKKIVPLSINSGEGFSQGLGTYAHRTN